MTIFFQQAEGGVAEGGVAELAALLRDQEESSATLCQEVTKLTAALQEYQDMVQVGESC